MSKLAWDQTGKRLYETGVDHGVLYIPDVSGNYDDGVAWNGLTTVTESPSGAEATPLYADNIKYLELRSAEEFGATIEAYTCPTEFYQFDGIATPTAGVHVGQQNRRAFGLSYRTRIGNDLEGTDYGYKLHLIYNATAAPSERANATINDSPEAITLSWELTTTPVTAGDNLKPTAHLTIDSTEVDADALQTLEDILYGTVSTDARLPFPLEVIGIFAGTTVEVTPTAPTFDAGTDIITIPTVVGVEYRINGVAAAPGAQPPITEDTLVSAHALPGYTFPPVVNDEWVFEV